MKLNLLSRKNQLEHPISELHREMDRLFGDFFAWPRGLAPLWNEGNGFLPALEVEETDKEVRVTVELPGLEEKDIQISVHDGVLELKGEKRQESERREGAGYRSERSYGSFQRLLQLPAEVDAAKAQARFKNGVLAIVLPKLAGSQPHRIAVQAE